MSKYQVELPQFTADMGKLAQMLESADSLNDGLTIYAGLATLINGMVTTTGKPRATEAADILGTSKGTISKGVTVVRARAPHLLDLPVKDVQPAVKAFLASLEGESVTSIYTALTVKPKIEDGEGEFSEAKAVALFATAIAYCAKYGQDSALFFAAAQG